MKDLKIDLCNTKLDEEELLKYSKKVADIHKELYKKADDEKEFLGWLKLPTDYDKKELVLLASVPSKLMFYNFEGKLEREYGLENENFSLNNIVVNKKQLWGNFGPGQDSCVGIAFWNTEYERFEFKREATLTQTYNATKVNE